MKSPKEIIDASRELVCELFSQSAMWEFICTVCIPLGKTEAIQNFEVTDEGTE